MIAAPVLRAMTATPPSGWNFEGQGQPCTSITFSTPGTFIASFASNETSLPPTTGGLAMTAYFMPGKRISAPYVALPVVMSCRSTMLILPLPI